jgi:hypothetical protein
VNTTPTTAPRTATYWIVRTVICVFIVATAGFSFLHIVQTSQMLGLTWEAWSVPFLIDGLAILGMLGRSARFAEETRRAGLKLMTGAGLVSLAANIAAGHNAGQRAFGVLIVVGFVISEWYGSKLTPAPATATTAPAVDDEAKAKRSARAVKAAATRKANQAAAVKADKAEARRLARQVRELEHSYSAADAPVSPAG